MKRIRLLCFFISITLLCAFFASCSTANENSSVTDSLTTSIGDPDTNITEDESTPPSKLDIAMDEIANSDKSLF